MGRNLTAAGFAGALVAMAVMPSVADEAFKLKSIISLNPGQTLRAFDISFVSTPNHSYALAASATAPFPGTGPNSNPAIVIVDTRTNHVIHQFNATPSFAGNCQASAAAPRNTFGGPNGVMIIEKGGNADIWAGDGPHFSTICDPTSKVTAFSSARVIDLHTGVTKATISTGGIRRADELCYNPRSDVVLIANDDTLDNFITFIGEDNFKVLQQIKFDGSDKTVIDPTTGKPLIANGIEQCQFDPRDGKFYINIPATGLTGSGPGFVLRISGQAPFKVETVIQLATACGGATGMAIGPDHQIGLACGGTATEIIDNRTGAQIGPLLPGLNGADEMWFAQGHYFFGISGPTGGVGTLGVADASAPSVDPPAPTASGSHSVAADEHQVFVPQRGAANGSVCSSAGGDNSTGCIAVYTAPQQHER
jgi:hypothetical protein